MKNVTLRNLLGGFLGGMLGILMFGLFHWPGLPFGCLFGVMFGWYHRELLSAFISDGKLSDIVKAVGIGTRLSKACRGFTLITPKHQICLFNALSLVTAGIIWTMLWGDMFTFTYYLGWMDQDARKWQVTFSVVTMMACAASVIFGIGLVWAEHPFRLHENGLKLYDKSGPVRFWASSTIMLIVSYVEVCAVALIFFLGLVIACIAFSAYALVWALWVVFRKTGHWPCLGITMTATSLTAWLMHPYIVNASGLWLVALIAGASSGLASVGLGFVFRGFAIEKTPEDVFNSIMNENVWDMFTGQINSFDKRFKRALGILAEFD